ncbi:MAG: hypothetical protein AAF846_27795 [Chloroflexota bacterium]
MTHNAHATEKFSLKDDLDVLNSMMERIVSHLQTDEIYGNQGMFVSGLPSVTLGGILLRIRRLNALRERVGKYQQVKLDEAIEKHDRVYHEWTSHYEKKLKVELQSRIERLEQFIQEYQDDPKQYMVAFEPERTRRTIVQEILYMMQRINQENNHLLTRLANLDDNLRSIVKPSTFQWASNLESVYSKDEFWWLHSILEE